MGQLIDTTKWQRLQDNFSNVTGVSLRTVDTNGNSITIPSNQPRLCSQIFRESNMGKACKPCLPTFLGGEGVVDKDLSFRCIADLHNFAVPLAAKNGGGVACYVIAGPMVLVMRKPKEEYAQLAEELGIDADELWSGLLEIKVMSFAGMRSLVALIKDIGEHILEEKKMPFDIEKMNHLLQILLDVAIGVSGADIGSVMLVDKTKDELAILASKGLTDTVAKNTRVRMGERICGIAAKEQRAFLIDENLKDNRIKNYLNRPNIKCSLVLPIKADDTVFGVMNLGVLEGSSVRFNADNMRLMNRLIDLATVALH